MVRCIKGISAGLSFMASLLNDEFCVQGTGCFNSLEHLDQIFTGGSNFVEAIHNFFQVCSSLEHEDSRLNDVSLWIGSRVSSRGFDLNAQATLRDCDGRNSYLTTHDYGAGTFIKYYLCHTVWGNLHIFYTGN